jgi:hypothetical protein
MAGKEVAVIIWDMIVAINWLKNEGFKQRVPGLWTLGRNQSANFSYFCVYHNFISFYFCRKKLL